MITGDSVVKNNGYCTKSNPPKDNLGLVTTPVDTLEHTDREEADMDPPNHLDTYGAKETPGPHESDPLEPQGGDEEPRDPTHHWIGDVAHMDPPDPQGMVVAPMDPLDGGANPLEPQGGDEVTGDPGDNVDGEGDDSVAEMDPPPVTNVDHSDGDEEKLKKLKVEDGNKADHEIIEWPPHRRKY